jgi:hypothetical protein
MSGILPDYQSVKVPTFHFEPSSDQQPTYNSCRSAAAKKSKGWHIGCFRQHCRCTQKGVFHEQV